MIIKNVAINHNPASPPKMSAEASSFKALMQEKRAEKMPSDIVDVQTSKITPSLKDAVVSMINHHEVASKSIKTFMTRTDYTPEKLLGIQYKTGLLFLREQMFCKTAELSANTFKNFTQMQV